ncbi:MAG: TIGR03862 family flavoprotein [Burkholderiaceae bacterium]|nr:TIGR03862 family flavoprotein [Burkholderiaceae bacterium]
MKDIVDKSVLKRVAIIGGGPAGLMAAQFAAQAGLQVDVYDAMPSVGRKFLLAGKGGLNLTHSESVEPFVSRYGARAGRIAALLQQFGADEVQKWAQALGVSTFVGSSGRVFPKDMKAAPLLRAWLHQLRAAGVQFHMRHRWLGWAEAGVERTAESSLPSTRSHELRFSTPTGPVSVHTDAVVLALGGGSWARLGSSGAWVPLLLQRGVDVQPLMPSNCGFDVGWTEHFASRFAGVPFKTVAITVRSDLGAAPHFSRQGEFVATATGVEGSLIYAASSLLRDDIAAHGSATFYLDLLPDRTPEQVLAEVRHPRGSRSLSSHLKSRLKLDGIKAAILHEILSKEAFNHAETLAAAIKSLPIHLKAARPLDEAISSAGGVAFEGLSPDLMLHNLAGVFCAGEMLDWEAPTGGYLLTGCLSSGAQAGRGVVNYLAQAGAESINKR